MKKTYIFFLIATVTLASCTKNFEDRNTNHEEATEEMMDYDNLRTGSAFSQMTRNVIPSYQTLNGEEYGSANYQVIQDLAGNIFAGYVGVVNTGFTANNLYDITGSTWYESMFSDAYSYVISPWIKLDEVREDFPEEAAMGDILKVATMHRVTDTYGPIPYSEVGSSSVALAYDSQEEVYNAMFTELDEAIEILTSFYESQPSTAILEDYDNVYSGDVENWVKFANTLRLRLAMHVVYADENLAMEEAAKSLSNSVGLMSSTADIAQLSKPSSGSWEYPPYVIQYSFDDARVGATIQTYMDGYSDPRESYYFTTGSDDAYHGVRNGITLTSSYQNSDLLSRINCTNDDAIVWMFPAEAYFLEAEYWLRNGDETQAKECYEDGVTIAFSTTGASGASSYLADDTSTVGSFTDVVRSSTSYNTALTSNTVAWEDGADFEVNFEKIITQKYIAMFPEGQEAWTEFRRTGYPSVIPVNTNNSSGAIDTDLQVRRLNYPSTEYRTNQTNVQAAVSVLNNESSDANGDRGGTRLWWDKNTRF